jgi:hypothetical protein
MHVNNLPIDVNIIERCFEDHLADPAI